MTMDVNEQKIANLGKNVKTLVKNENCMVLMLSDSTGEGVMTVYQVMPGVMICFSDMHMERCDSEFELKRNMRVLCIDHCREGRIEMEVGPGVSSIMQENEIRLDNRENHKGTSYYPLRHYHGVSVLMDVEEAQRTLDEMFHGFSVDIAKLRQRYCNQEKPYAIREDAGLSSIISSLYQRNMERAEVSEAKEYYQIKVVEMLLHLEAMAAEDTREVRPYYYKTQMEKIKAVHTRITENLKERYTIEELADMYDIPATSMKKCFKDVYGDSIYSYQKRYRINIAASMLIQDKNKEIQEIASFVGYENPGKFSVAFRSIMGVSPAEYRIRKEGIM